MAKSSNTKAASKEVGRIARPLGLLGRMALLILVFLALAYAIKEAGAPELSDEI